MVVLTEVHHRTRTSDEQLGAGVRAPCSDCYHDLHFPHGPAGALPALPAVELVYVLSAGRLEIWVSFDSEALRLNSRDWCLRA
jgi:hypothetical protein